MQNKKLSYYEINYSYNDKFINLKKEVVNKAHTTKQGSNFLGMSNTFYNEKLLSLYNDNYIFPANYRNLNSVNNFFFRYGSPKETDAAFVNKSGRTVGYKINDKIYFANDKPLNEDLPIDYNQHLQTPYLTHAEILSYYK